MKRNNKKGFTIVELVIVIAVIAILSAVLIPTFGGIIADAQAKADLLDARNAQQNYLSSIANVTDLGTGRLFVCDSVTDDEGNTTHTWYGTNSANEFAKISAPTDLTENDVVITLKGEAHKHTLGTAATTCDDCGATVPAK